MLHTLESEILIALYPTPKGPEETL